MQEYDFIMAGGGMAGLSLAHELVTGPYPNASILLVDPETKGENDRTWSFWTGDQDPLPTLGGGASIVSQAWSQLRFASHEWEHTFDMGDYRYCMVRGADFYDQVLATLEDARGVTFQRSVVQEIRNHEEYADVVTDAGTFRGRWVFDSRFDPAEYEQRTGPHHYLKQHFVGWTIETPGAAFDPEVLTLFDFRTPQHAQMRFIYILPFSPTRALVEYTLFSAELLEREEYTRAIEAYLRDVYGLTDYRVVERENGVIPMTDEPAPRVEGARTLAVGTRGGRVKASTGYAFRRTQLDTAAIVESLVQHGHPFDLPEAPGRFRALDTMLLQVMYRRGELSEKVFTYLFRRNPLSRMLRFLDEEVSVPEMLAVMATVPLGPFLRAFWRTQILGKV